uniref:FadR/GntR family transcriptional regulator n=1 Tax=Rhizobium sp. F40D2 TaxID=3453141 RepID=UPI003F272BF5
MRATSDTGRALTMARRASLRDQFEASLALDVEAARLTAIRKRPETVAALRRLLAERGSYGGGDQGVFIERDLAFHRAVIAASGNRAMIEIYDFFLGLDRRYHRGDDARQGYSRTGYAGACRYRRRHRNRDPDKADLAVRRFMAPGLRPDRMIPS